MAEKEVKKIVVHEGEDCKMAEAVQDLGSRIGNVEKDIGNIKGNVEVIQKEQHIILKSHNDFKLAFSEHCTRDDEKMKALNKVVDRLTDMWEGLKDTQGEHSKELMRLELKSELDNVKQEKEIAERKLQEVKESFWGKLKSKAEDKIIEILLWSTVAGLALYFGGQYLSAIVEKL